MRKQMILTVFVVAVAARAEAEFQIRAVELRASADRAFMLGYLSVRIVFHSRSLRIVHAAFKLPFPVYLLWRNPLEIPGGQEKDHKIQ